jgi:hypothetical protein
LTWDVSGFDAQPPQGALGVIAVQPGSKVKLELESSTVVLTPVAKTANRSTVKECGSHITGLGDGL